MGSPEDNYRISSLSPTDYTELISSTAPPDSSPDTAFDAVVDRNRSWEGNGNKENERESQERDSKINMDTTKSSSIISSPSSSQPLTPLSLDADGRYNVEWVKDSLVSFCLCKRQFSFTLRKHHCRVCGEVFCNSCCGERRRIEGLRGLQRVCITCLKLAEDGREDRKREKQRQSLVTFPVDDDRKKEVEGQREIKVPGKERTIVKNKL